MIFASALQVDNAIFFSALITVAAFVPLFTMQGVEGQIFNPMARTYGLALAGALLSTFTVTPVLASFLLPQQVQGNRDHRCTHFASDLCAGSALVAAITGKLMLAFAAAFLAVMVFLGIAARQRVPAGA